MRRRKLPFFLLALFLFSVVGSRLPLPVSASTIALYDYHTTESNSQYGTDTQVTVGISYSANALVMVFVSLVGDDVNRPNDISCKLEGTPMTKLVSLQEGTVGAVSQGYIGYLYELTGATSQTIACPFTQGYWADIIAVSFTGTASLNIFEDGSATNAADANPSTCNGSCAMTSTAANISPGTTGRWILWFDFLHSYGTTVAATYSSPSSGFTNILSRVDGSIPGVGDTIGASVDYDASSGSQTPSDTWSQSSGNAGTIAYDGYVVAIDPFTAATTTTANCSPSTIGLGSSSSCTATITGASSPISGETITWSQVGGSGSVTFPSGNTCTLSGTSCSVMVTGDPGGVTLKASYTGDSNNAASSGTFNLTVNPAPPIPEYPLGLPLLAILMIFAYGLIKHNQELLGTRQERNATPSSQ